jgi:predicted RNase H-like HicB family nuclease
MGYKKDWMMTKNEALKMAIEALQEAKEQIGGLPTLDKLIQNCKEALEQAEADKAHGIGEKNANE